MVEEFDSSTDGDVAPDSGSTATNGSAADTAVALAAIDRAAVEHAFEFACERHADQLRHSGDEFITHPVGVAQICAGMRLDTGDPLRRAPPRHGRGHERQPRRDPRASSARRSPSSSTA